MHHITEHDYARLRDLDRLRAQLGDDREAVAELNRQLARQRWMNAITDIVIAGVAVVLVAGFVYSILR